MKISKQYLLSGLSLVDPSAAPGVWEITFRSFSEILLRFLNLLLIIPLTPFNDPKTEDLSFFSSLIIDTKDILMTLVGPPPWAINIFLLLNIKNHGKFLYAD